KQIAYNLEHGIDPTPLRKRIADILDQLIREDADTEKLLGGGGRQQSRGKAPVPGLSSRARQAADKAASGAAAGGSEARGDLIALIGELTEQMHAAAAELQFEVAARIRDEIKDLKHELRGMQAAGVQGAGGGSRRLRVLAAFRQLRRRPVMLVEGRPRTRCARARRLRLRASPGQLTAPLARLRAHTRAGSDRWSAAGKGRPR